MTPHDVEAAAQVITAAFQPEHPTAVSEVQEALRTQVGDHYVNMYRVMERLDQRVINLQALSMAIAGASLVGSVLPGETTVSMMCQSDIPAQDARAEASWYGDVVGASPMMWRMALFKIYGIAGGSGAEKQTCPCSC